MRILWVTNVVFPHVANRTEIPGSISGGWLYNLADKLSERGEISLGVVIAYVGGEFRMLREHNIDFYLIPMTRFGFLFGTQSQKRLIRRTVEAFNPDIIHLHGAELPFASNFIKLFPERKIVLNIQTLSSGIRRELFAGMKLCDVLRCVTLREALSLRGIILRMAYANIRVKRETWYFRNIRYIIGSTLWDAAFLKGNGFTGKYYPCPYLFRDEFYSEENRWQIDTIERHSIMTGQAAEPLKGSHILIEAVFYVKKEIPDVRLYIPGPDLLSDYYLKRYGYARYIRRLIKKLSLQDTVVFTGPLDAGAMARRMKLSNAVVVPSAVELGSSTLCEGMLLGMPVIASFRGGMTESISHGRSGYYYDFKEKYLLAAYIKRIFESDALAIEFSRNARTAALREHGAETCVNAFCSAYNDIIAGGKPYGTL